MLLLLLHVVRMSMLHKRWLDTAPAVTNVVSSAYDALDLMALI